MLLRCLLRSVCIGLSLQAASIAQDPHGWVFDHKDLWKRATPLLPIGEGDEADYWRQVWTRSSRQGPIQTRQIIHSLDRKNRFELKLCLVGALGLSGGKAARHAITRFLAKPQNAAYRVLAALAASRHRVAFPKGPLLEQASDSQPESQVVRLAARLALLASYPREAAHTMKGRVRDKELDPFLNALWAAWNPAESLDQMRSLPELKSKEPYEGSLEELGERAFLLLAVTRPGRLLSANQLEDMLSRGQSSRNLGMASLALGRLHKSQGQTNTIPEHANLIRPLYLLGLGLASKNVIKELVRGPGAVRPNNEKSWHWAVAVRLLPSADLATILPALLEQPYDLEVHELGIKALLWRVLVLGDKLLADKSVTKLSLDDAIASESPWLISLRVLANPKEGVPLAVTEQLGGRRAFALRMYLETKPDDDNRRLGNDARDARLVLWKLLQSEDWLRPTQGPGSIEDHMLVEMNQLTWDIFLRGSNFITRKKSTTSALRDTLFFPKGIRRSKETFHRVLDVYLEDYPIFRSWPGADAKGR